VTIEKCPVRVVLRVCPNLEIGDIERRDGRLETKFSSASSNEVCLAQFPECISRTEELVAEFHRLHRRRDFSALRSLIDNHPELAADDSIAAKLLAMHKAKCFQMIRGRPTGSTCLPPILVLKLVKQAIGSGDADNPEQAFRLFEKAEICAYETAKKLYYRGLHNRYARALVIAKDAPHPASPEELKEPVDVPADKSTSPIQRGATIR